VVPELDVRGLLRGVTIVRGGRREPGQRRDGVAVLARVVRELVAGQLAHLPAAIEGMAQDVPAVADRIQTLEQVHGGSFHDPVAGSYGARRSGATG
jgi:hypothetical protein